MRKRLLVCDRGVGRWTRPTGLISAIAVVSLSACVWSAAAYGAESEHACASPSAGHPQCYAILDKTKEGVKTYTAGSGELGGFDPSDLRSAYKLPSSGGSGQTVAIVDAYNDPNAESDLAAYRSHYGLSECTKANECFKKVNQKGEEGSYPTNEAGWSVEISLDLDMVSAVCPGCHILLVEANEPTVKEMAAAVNEAATKGATEISNSYGLPEEYDPEGKGYISYDSNYSHKGIPITVSSGDEGYDNWEDGAKSPSFPASVPEVIAVGGTTLLPTEEGSRGWAETVWGTAGLYSSGGGCSKTQPKPSWQDFYTACEHRMDNDAAAVADPSTPVSIYDTYGHSEKWHDVGGTSVAAPLIAGAEALSTSYARSLGGADAFYVYAKHMFDIKIGTNFAVEEGCLPLSLCNAQTGYDGPSGNGTPDGAIEIGQITEYSLPSGSGPNAVTAGPDGNLWFANFSTNKIGETTTSGTITEYALPEKSEPYGITAGPAKENALWFTDAKTSKVGKITTSGTITEYSLPAESRPKGIAAGPDGNLWVAERGTNKIGKIATSGTVTEYALPAGSEPMNVSAGPEKENALWFTERGTNKIGKITTSGTVTEYALPAESSPLGIAAGPEKENALWFTERGTNKIGKITTSGTVTEYALPAGSEPDGITPGPEKENALWFTERVTNKIGKITTSGTVTEYTLPAESKPSDIATGADNNLWFIDSGSNKVGMLIP